MKNIHILYRFILPDYKKEIFDLTFSADTLLLINRYPETLPDWTKLSFCQCTHCPFDLTTVLNCPVAVNLITVIDRFDHLMSYDRIFSEVTVGDRVYHLKTSVQEGLSSIIGLLVAGSCCPYTDFFKPMARFHVPFGTKEETIWRAASTYLLLQYFKEKNFQAHHFEINGLIEIYNNIEILNEFIISRIRHACKKDSIVNALVHLDVFAKYLSPTIKESLNHVHKIFNPFLSQLKKK